MSVTRFSKLKGFNHVLAGRDLAGFFTEGHVYQVDEVLGVIMIKDLGEYAMPKDHTNFPSIMQDGTYLLTIEEYKRSNER